MQVNFISQPPAEIYTVYVVIIVGLIFHRWQLGKDFYPSYGIYPDKGKIVNEFAKRGLIHASNFPTLKKYNFICKQVVRL